MLQRHMHKGAPYRRHLAVQPGSDGMAGEVARLRISGEGPRGIAKHVARTLVEQKYQRYAAPGIIFPTIQSPRSSGFMVREETLRA